MLFEPKTPGPKSDDYSVSINKTVIGLSNLFNTSNNISPGFYAGLGFGEDGSLYLVIAKNKSEELAKIVDHSRPGKLTGYSFFVPKRVQDKTDVLKGKYWASKGVQVMGDRIAYKLTKIIK